MVKIISFFSLFCGTGMLLVWILLLLGDQVPELTTSPFQTIFLLAAEVITAISLLIGGYGLLTRRHWGLHADLAALGMLTYCAIFSIGVFGQQDNIPAMTFFAVISMLAIVFTSKFVFHPTTGDRT
jgi:hypothetical protein